MESHRTSLVFRNLQELGRRAVAQLSKDSQLPSYHLDQDWFGSVCLSRPRSLSNRPQCGSPALPLHSSSPPQDTTSKPLQLRRPQSTLQHLRATQTESCNSNLRFGKPPPRIRVWSAGSPGILRFAATHVLLLNESGRDTQRLCPSAYPHRECSGRCRRRGRPRRLLPSTVHGRHSVESHAAFLAPRATRLPESRTVARSSTPGRRVFANAPFSGPR